MSAGGRFAILRDRWFVASVGGTFLVLVFSLLVGFVWLPTAQDDAMFKGLLNSICSAAGVPRSWLSSSSPNVTSLQPVSAVVLSPDMLDQHGAEGSVGRGGTIALRCTMCHGARGVSSSETPNLAGQEAASIYKQMRDFQNGARVSAVMAPFVVDLSDQDLRDVSAFYASLPRGAKRDPDQAPDIVAVGSPMRNIAPCGSCHGAMTVKLGTPWLDPQPRTYLERQLHAFARGERRNDTGAQMRNVARNMTAAEISAAASYYSATK
jgi:cytochrome c553